MSILSILLTSFALSMDAFAVSITKGMTLKNINKKLAFKIAFFFGLFQGGMPLIGWALGIGFEKYIKAFDHWIALILLALLGGKMIYESLKGDDEDELAVELADGNTSIQDTDIPLKDLLVLSVATSIDALAVGVSFAFLNISIIPVVSAIAIITFLMCFMGVLIGRKIGPILKNYAEIIGGVILIFIGFNIFNEHTNFLGNIFNNLF